MTEQVEESDWLDIAQDAFESSTTYVDANYRKQWERNIALFQSRHPVGSKYNSVAYKARSRLFRPKTRSVIRKNEAAAAAAFFANPDVVSVEPENDADMAQVASAELMNELINYRLTKSVPWFQTLIGAVQEAQVIGVVCSHNYWDYQEKPGKKVPVTDDQGQPLTDEKGNMYVQDGPPEIVVDKPCIKLIPVENYRFHPAADWTDPVTSSPYFLYIVPMYVADIKERMEDPDPKKKWKKLEDGEIRTALADYDTTRQARENPRQDPQAEAETGDLTDYEISYVHQNFVRKDGEEWVYWTLGTQHMLSDPVKLKEAFFHGERPFTFGCGVIEAHKAMPESIAGLGSELQKEVNETVNQRRDNVSLVLNKRYIVKRGAQVDTESLLRNVAGGVTLANDVETDIREMEFNDVTASSYQEQDRLNVDYDELTGNFSQASVLTNRKLNETVGGMQLMGSGANQMTEYFLRTVVETWVEPTLRQMVKLEQYYETDLTILGVAGQQAKLAQKYGVDHVTDQLLNQSLTVRVNVGLGTTDPHQKLGRFMFALQTYGTASQIPGVNMEEVAKEIFGLAGYKGGMRFVGSNPANQMLTQHLQELQQQLQQATQERDQAKADAIMSKLQAAKAALDTKQAQIQGVIDKANTSGTAPDMKPIVDKLTLERDKSLIPLEKANAVLQIQLAEKTAELQLEKAAGGLDVQRANMQTQMVQHKASIDTTLTKADAAFQTDKAKGDADRVKEQAKADKAKAEPKVVEKTDQQMRKIMDTMTDLVDRADEADVPIEIISGADGRPASVKRGSKVIPIIRR